MKPFSDWNDVVIDDCPHCGNDYQVVCDIDETAVPAVEVFAVCVRCGTTFDSFSEHRREAAVEANRIQGVLDSLDELYAENGVVRTILRARIAQERRRAEGLE